MPQTKEQRASQLAVMQADAYDPRHGTLTGYVYGCRCSHCAAAMAERDAAPERRTTHRDYALRRKYPDLGGVAGWEQLWTEQHGLCAACSEPMTRHEGQTVRDTDAVVDHEHRTGVSNALLCNRCNLTLGKVNNDPALLIALARYADEYHSADFFPERATL
jgi:hypothetical protein